MTRLGFADLMIVAAAACWAGYVLWGKGTLKRVDSLVYTTWAMIAGAAATLVFSLLFRQPLKPPLDPEVLVLLAVLVAGPTIGAFWLWNIATRRRAAAFIEHHAIPDSGLCDPVRAPSARRTARRLAGRGHVPDRRRRRARPRRPGGSLKRAAARLKKRL